MHALLVTKCTCKRSDKYNVVWLQVCLYELTPLHAVNSAVRGIYMFLSVVAGIHALIQKSGQVYLSSPCTVKPFTPNPSAAPSRRAAVSGARGMIDNSVN